MIKGTSTSMERALKVSKFYLIVIKGGLKSSILYCLCGTIIIGDATIIYPSSNSDDTNIWHIRFRHKSKQTLHELCKRCRLDEHNINKLQFCEHCVFGKHKRVSFNTTNPKSKSILSIF
jgi:ribosomal protein L37E